MQSLKHNNKNSQLIQRNYLTNLKKNYKFPRLNPNNNNNKRNKMTQLIFNKKRAKKLINNNNRI